MSDNLEEETKQKSAEFQFPFDSLPKHLQNEFLDKLSLLELWTLTDLRNNWSTSCTERMQRFCAFRFFMIFRQHSKAKKEMLTIPCLNVGKEFVTHEAFQYVQTDYNPQGFFLWMPWSIFSEFLQDYKYVIKEIYTEDITQDTVDTLKSLLKPFGCHVPKVSLLISRNFEEYYQEQTALEDLLQHFSVRALDYDGTADLFQYDYIQKIDELIISQRLSDSDLFNFKGSVLGIHSSSISSEAVLAILRVPPNIDRPLKELRLQHRNETQVLQIINVGNERSREEKEDGRIEILLDFGSDETQWMCRTERNWRSLIDIEFIHVPIDPKK